MDVIITYKKNNRTKRLSNIEFVEFDTFLNRFHYWEFGKGEKGKSIGLRLVHNIKVNAPERAKEMKHIICSDCGQMTLVWGDIDICEHCSEAQLATDIEEVVFFQEKRNAL